MSMYLLLCFLAIYVFVDKEILCDPVDYPVTSECLGCLCHAISECDSKTKCDDDACGPFRITWKDWQDGGSLTINDSSPNKNESYVECANNFYCSTQTIQEYMKIYRRDCNGDGIINCDDYLAIQIYGSDECEKAIPEDYRERYDSYRKKFNFCLS